MALRAASLGEVLGGLLVPVEEVQADAAAAAGGAAGGASAPLLPRVFGDDEDVEAGEGLGVGGEGAVGCGDEDAAEFVGVAGADLDDARVEGAGGAVGALDELELGGDVGVGGRPRRSG